MAMPTMNRRRFIQLSAAVAGVAAVGSRFVQLPDAGLAGAAGLTREEGEWIATCCNMCGGQTGVLCNVVNGRLVKIEPNPDNPIGVSNISTDYWAHKQEGAAMCPKGNAGIMTLYDPDRLKKPLKRTNPQKGKGVDPQWKEISWEEAIDEIAAKLGSLRQSGEAHKLIWFSEDHSFTHPQQDFCALFGTPNYFNHSNLCDVARKASFKLVMGDERPLADPIQSRYIMLFGWNPLSAIKWSHLPRVFMRAIENGAKLVVVDPYLSFTASKAHEWIPLRPATDGALALGMANAIIEWNLQDQAFIDEWTVGFDRFKTFVKDKTPEWAEQITNVPADTIRRLARELATTRPALVDAWSGPGQHSNAVQGGRAIALLNVLTGNIDKPGTLINPDKRGSARNAPSAPAISQPRLDGHGTKYPFSHGSGIYTEVLDNLRTGQGPYQPKVGMVVFQNLVLSVPGTDNVIEALKKLEFLLVVDTHMSETALMADIAIPGTTYLERYDLNSNWVTWSTLGLRQPVVKPIFGQLPEYDFVAAVGNKLGLKDKDGKAWFGNWDYETYLSKELENGAPKITLAQLKALPGATWIDKKGTAYEKFKEEIKMPDGGTLDEATGVAKDKDGKAVGVQIGDKLRKGFNTPSRKLEFYSDQAAKKKDANGRTIDGLPSYSPRDWFPDEKFPLYLVNWKEVTHTHSRTFNNPYLMELQPSNRLAINTATAEKLGIKDGDKIVIESPYGKAEALARLTEGIHPEVVGWQHGFGHWGFGKVAKGKGTADGQFNKTISDPVSGMALHKEVCVKVYRA